MNLPHLSVLTFLSLGFISKLSRKGNITFEALFLALTIISSANFNAAIIFPKSFSTSISLPIFAFDLKPVSNNTCSIIAGP